MSGPSAPKLSALDQTAPKYWIRVVLCYATDPKASAQKVVQTLQTGLDETSKEIPSIASALYYTQDEASRLIVGIRPAGIPVIKMVNDMTTDYSELRKRNFDSCLAQDLCATTQYTAPGPEIGPAFAAQANIISGGLLLGLSFWHGVIDGITMTTILQIWAQNCRLASDNTPLATDLHLSESAYDDTPFSQSSKNPPSQIADHPEYIILPEPPSEMPPFMTKILETQIFRFSPSAVAFLKNICSPKNCSVAQSEYTWVSTNTALAALMWRTIIKATHSNVAADSNVECTCSMPLDSRQRSDPPNDPHMLGSPMTVSISRLPLTSVTSSTSSDLADLALNIRRGVDATDSKYINSLISMVNHCAAPALIFPSLAPGILDTSVIVSSWKDFPVYDYDWGETLGEKCERLRSVGDGVFHGMQVVLPMLPDGTIEVAIALEKDVLQRLNADEVWGQYTQML